MSDHVAALSPVARAEVDAAGVAGLEVDVSHDVVLHLVLVAAEQDSCMGHVVDEVVAGPIAHSGHAHAWAIGDPEVGAVVYVVVVCEVVAWGQALAIPAAECDAAVSAPVHVVALRAGVGAARYADAPGAAVAHDAARNEAVLRVAHLHRSPVAHLEDEPPNRHVLSALDPHHVVRERHDHVVGMDCVGRPEIERMSAGVSVPFTGRVEFLEQPLDVVAVTDPKRSPRASVKRDRALLRDVLRDGQNPECPVVTPEDGHSCALRVLPLVRLVRAVHELPVVVAALDCRDVRPRASVGVIRVEVGIACQSLPVSAKEELAELGARQALGSQIALHDLAFPGREAADYFARAHNWFVVSLCAVDDWSRLSPGVLLAQGKGLGQVVCAWADQDGRALGQAASSLERAHFVASALERREGAVAGAGHGPAAGPCVSALR